MAYSLSENGSVGYSPSERLVFKILNRRSLPTPSTIIVGSFYKEKGSSVPYNSRQIVMGSLRSLVKKLEANKEEFRVKRIKREGNKVLEYQLVDAKSA
jgi:hypothetical protein